MYYKKLLKKSLKIIYVENKNELYFYDKDSLCQIKINKQIERTQFFENNIEVKTTFEEIAIVIKLLSLIDRYIFSFSKRIDKILNRLNLDKVNPDIIFNNNKINDEPSNYYTYRRFNYDSNGQIKNLSNLKKQNLNNIVVYDKLPLNEFIEISKNILVSKNITIYGNIIVIKNKEFSLDYDLNDISALKYLDNSYSLNHEQLKIILFLIKFKDPNNKIIKEFFFINNDLKIDMKINPLIELDNSFDLYELKNFRTIYKLSRIDVLKSKIRKQEIINNCKSKSKLNDNDFMFDDNGGFGTIGELLGKSEVVSKIEFKDPNTLKPYFKERVLNRKVTKKEEPIKSLVLWDIENINYYNDFSNISQFVKDSCQIKIVSYNEKFKSYSYKRIDFLIKKLRKRKWIIKETKKIADNELIMEFHNYKDQIEELVVISNDSDFKDIIIEANQLKINTIVLYKNNNKKIKSHWLSNANRLFNLEEEVS